MLIMKKIWKASAISSSSICAVLVGIMLLCMAQTVSSEPVPVETEIGAIIQGRLEEGDSRLSAGQYADAYTFAGTAGEAILLNLTSSGFDGFLSLLNSEGDLIAIDDDTGDGTGALISKFTLPETDTYTIQVSSYHANETGEYTLSLHDTPVVYSAEQLALGEQIKGELTDDDEQFDTGQHFDAYSFAAEAGQAVSITMRSNRLDTYLWLLNEEDRVMTVNDDQNAQSSSPPAAFGSGFHVMPGRAGHPGAVIFLGSHTGQASEIVFFPPVTGTYTVLAGSRAAGAEGEYSLDIATVAVPENVSSGNFSDGASGELSSSDYQLSSGQYVDVYTLSGEQGQSISILLNSSSFSGLLRLFDREGNLVREATSIENFILPATGTYYLWVSSIFNGSTGNYTLSFSNGGDDAVQEMAVSSESGNDAEEGVQLFIQKTGGGRAVQGDAAFSEMAAASPSGDRFGEKGGVPPYIPPSGKYTAKVKVTVHKSRLPLTVTVTLTATGNTGSVGTGSTPPKELNTTNTTCSSDDYCTYDSFIFELEASENAPAGKYTIKAEVSGVGSDVDYLYVVSVDKVELRSGNAVSSPVIFEGGKFELGDPCSKTDPEKALVIFNKTVRSASNPLEIRDFLVGAKAFINPEVELPTNLQNIDKWSKITGPDSGSLSNAKELDVYYQYPKKGGVYELQFELFESKTKSLLNLPLAGPDATAWCRSQATKINNLILKISTLNAAEQDLAILFTGRTLDWYGSASPRGCTQYDPQGETLTIGGVVVDRAKLQNFMWGYFIRAYYPGNIDWGVAKIISGLGGTPDTPAAIAAYEVGKAWRDGEDIAVVMKNQGHAMQEPNGIAEKLWPNENVMTSAPSEPIFFTMTAEEIMDWVYEQINPF